MPEELYDSHDYCLLVDEYCSLAEENESLKSRIAELEAAQKWIPVSERLPEKSETVLVLHDNAVDIVTYHPKSNRWELLWWVNADLHDVTHWMPLPEPPEVK